MSRVPITVFVAMLAAMRHTHGARSDMWHTPPGVSPDKKPGNPTGTCFFQTCGECWEEKKSSCGRLCEDCAAPAPGPEAALIETVMQVSAATVGKAVRTSADISVHAASGAKDIEMAFQQGQRVNASAYALLVLSEAQAAGQLQETEGCGHLTDQGMMAAQCSMLLNEMNWAMMCGMPPYSSCFKTCCSHRGGEGSPHPEVCKNMNFHGVLCTEIINKFNKDEACFQNQRSPQWMLDGAEDLRSSCPVQCEQTQGQMYMRQACSAYVIPKTRYNPGTKGVMCAKDDFAEACTGLCCQDDY